MTIFVNVVALFGYLRLSCLMMITYCGLSDRPGLYSVVLRRTVVGVD